MNAYDIIRRLKSTEYKYTEARRIKEEIRQLPRTEQLSIRTDLTREKQKSDNNDIIDVVNDIINDIDRNN